MKSFITTLMIGVFAYPATAIMADVLSASNTIDLATASPFMEQGRPTGAALFILACPGAPDTLFRSQGIATAVPVAFMSVPASPVLRRLSAVS